MQNDIPSRPMHNVLEMSAESKGARLVGTVSIDEAAFGALSYQDQVRIARIAAEELANNLLKTAREQHAKRNRPSDTPTGV